jgi:NAD/NADP transhydrogenase beta subunit
LSPGYAGIANELFNRIITKILMVSADAKK